MQWTIILEATTGWGERTCTPVYTLSRPTLDLKPEQVGLTLAEAKSLLARLQEQLIRQQADEYATCRRVCPCCYRMQLVKGYQSRILDTLFGPVHVESPRWQVCPCRCHWDHPPTFSPLSEILPQRCTPELEYLLARFAGLMPYRQVVQLLQECFPVSPTLSHFTVRRRTLRVAQRLEADLKAEVPAEPRALRPSSRPPMVTTACSSASTRALCAPATQAAHAISRSPWAAANGPAVRASPSASSPTRK